MTITARNLAISTLAAGLIALSGASAFADPGMSSRPRAEHFVRYHHQLRYHHVYRRGYGLGGGAAARSDYGNPWATHSQLYNGRPQGS